jgi:tetratricopeptide (TPR) repeat protein
MEKNYLIAKDYETMKKIAYDCISIDENEGVCYWYLGLAEIFLGDQINGKKHIQESLDKYYTSPPYLQLGVAYLSQNNYKDAATIYQKLVSIYPNNASYHATFALLLRQIGNYDKAGDEAIEVFKLQPENQEAQTFLTGLLGLSPNSPDLHTSMAFIYRRLNKENLAKQELLIAKSLYLQLLVQYPKNPDYHFKIAGVYQELGENEKAIDEAFITIELSPENLEKVKYFLTGIGKGYEEEIAKRLKALN